MTHENQLTFFRRFWIYQKERFPFVGHLPLIFMFTFSAIAYSRICRSQSGFIQWKDFAIGFFTTLTLFFLLRISDEFKDREIDAKYRPELPVPRGLMKLSELKIMGMIVIVLQCILILWIHPSMFLFYIIVLAYLAFMTVEFFAHDWLNNHMLAYMASHMVIIPLVDIYASGLDWYLDGNHPHWGLLFFFAVSYFNGMVLEIGRKLKHPADEKEGVVTYSGLYGYQRASTYWILILSLTAFAAAVACHYANLSVISYYILATSYSIGVFAAIKYKRNPSQKASKTLEIISGIWTLLMYGTLGGIPGLISYVL